MLDQAETYLQAEELDQAKRVYLSLVERWPEDVQAIEGLMSITKKQNATAEYWHWCEELLRFRPWSREANIAVGKAYLDEKRLSDAVSRFMLVLQESDFQNQKKEVQQLLKEAYRLQQEQPQEQFYKELGNL